MKLLEKLVSVSFILMIIILLAILFLFDDVSYITERTLLFKNIYSLIFIFVVFLLGHFSKKKEISQAKYYKIVTVLFFILFLVQLFIVTYGYFTPTWDAGHLKRTVNHFMKYKLIDDMEYMTRYPNNTMLTFILILIRSIPFLGSSNYILLVFNCLLVNLSSLFVSLSIKRITGSKWASLFSYLLTVPLIVFSPWILVVYSDTFSCLFPILIFYIYSKKEKDYRDYFFILFLSILGYYIKPTVIIILIAIALVEIFNIRRWNYKYIIKSSLGCALGVILAVSINRAGQVYMQYKPVLGVTQFNMIHFVAMGLNGETQGIYNGQDVEDTKNFGNEQNKEKIVNRLKMRSLKEHKEFYLKKTLINYNDGAFAWGKEGAFYLNRLPSENPISNFIYNLYKDEVGEVNIYFSFLQYLWLFVLFFIPFSSTHTYPEKNRIVLRLTIIGITLFLTIFEARARYLYPFAPIFVVLGVSGYYDALMRVQTQKV